MQKIAGLSTIALPTKRRSSLRKHPIVAPVTPRHAAIQPPVGDLVAAVVRSSSEISHLTGLIPLPGTAALPKRRLDPRRVVLADGNNMFRRELLAQIRQVTGDADIHEVQTARELIDTCSGDAADNDMFLVDMAMPGLGGTEGLCTLRRLRPDALIVAIGCPPDAMAVRAVFDAGISACILRSMNSQAFAAALALVMNGERFFPASLMLASPRENDGRDTSMLPASGGHFLPFADGLTPRQREVLQHLSMGKSNKDIARALNIEEITVKVHLRAIFVCLDVSNRTQAAMHAERAGWFPRSVLAGEPLAIARDSGDAGLPINH